MLKRLTAFVLMAIISMTMVSGGVTVSATTDENVQENMAENDGLGIESKAAVLMEKTTGSVLYEKNADEKLSPASITKIMTLILIFDNIESGKIKLEDMVTTSEYAKSMGGSQVFLETGEQQTVDTLIKCIIVASGNDASVAMAEHIAGTEGEFVKMMNKRAKELGMNSTNFEDCCGLTDSTNHYTSARDVAIMSRELISKYPQIHNYSTIWMENITHTTDKGTKEFGLTNTNKLLKQYQWTTGLKTGSTSLAKYCVSATAKKNDIELIAVIMAAPDYKIRFSEAIKLLEYGYGKCDLYSDVISGEKVYVKIDGGVKEKVKCSPESDFNYLGMNGENLQSITKKIIKEKNVKASVKKGDVMGKYVYYIDGSEIGSTNIIAMENVKKMKYTNAFVKIGKKFLIDIKK
ncbi:MAG: D-alanyl-D-alanine carboxypeptidase [Lachnospiraceae bacterium]|nr:D-alanyl-D-alanine carboxypeptidase [Lachnospiraceae bacterium]